MIGLYEWYSSLTNSWFGAIDYIEAIFWSLVYLAIIFTTFFNKNEKRFPISSTTIFINLSWETASVISYICDYGLYFGFTRSSFIRYSWLLLDILIVLLFNHKHRKNPKYKKYFCFYTLFYFCFVTLFFLCFEKLKYGMVISAFIIDAHMEILFWKNRKKLDPSNRLTIAILKILGDFFAGMYYGRSHIVVFILAVVAFVFDVMYIIYAVREQRKQPEIKEHFHNELINFYREIKNKLLPKKNYQNRRKYKKKKKNKKTHRKK